MEWFSKSFGVTAFATAQMIIFLSAIGSSAEFRTNVKQASEVVSVAIILAGLAYIVTVFFFYCAEREANASFNEHWIGFLTAALGQAAYICLFHAAGYAVVNLIMRQ